MDEKEIVNKVKLWIRAAVFIPIKHFQPTYGNNKILYSTKKSIFQNYELIRVKLDKALKDKVIALEDRLNILLQLSDAEQRVLDSNSFQNIIKVIY